MSLCQPCSEKNPPVRVTATRLVGLGRVPMCTYCWKYADRSVKAQGAEAVGEPETRPPIVPATEPAPEEKPMRGTPLDVESLKRDYAAGLSIVKIAKSHRSSPPRVRKALVQAGATIARGRRRRAEASTAITVRPIRSHPHRSGREGGVLGEVEALLDARWSELTVAQKLHVLGGE